jgi:large subunit ribosomal protein L18
MDKNIIKSKALARKKRSIRKRISGSATRPRLSVFRSEKHIYAQLIDDLSGSTIASASSIAKDQRAALADKGPLDVAKAVGVALAGVAKAKDIEEVVFDRNGRSYVGRIAALAEGAREGGLRF